MTETPIHQVFGGQPGDGRVVAVDLRQAQTPHLVVEVNGRDAGPQQLAGTSAGSRRGR